METLIHMLTSHPLATVAVAAAVALANVFAVWLVEESKARAARRAVRFI